MSSFPEQIDVRVRVPPSALGNLWRHGRGPSPVVGVALVFPLALLVSLVLAARQCGACDLLISATAREEQTPVGEPAVIMLSFSNPCPDDIEVYLGTRGRQRIGIRASDQSGRVVGEVGSLAPFEAQGVDYGPFPLQPGGTYRKYVVVERWISLDRPGIYEIEIAISPEGRKVEIVHTRIVKTPHDAKAVEAAFRRDLSEIGSGPIDTVDFQCLNDKIAEYSWDGYYRGMDETLRSTDPMLWLCKDKIVIRLGSRARGGDAEARRVLEGFYATCVEKKNEYSKSTLERVLRLRGWAAAVQSETDIDEGTMTSPVHVDNPFLNLSSDTASPEESHPSAVRNTAAGASTRTGPIEAPPPSDTPKTGETAGAPTDPVVVGNTGSVSAPTSHQPDSASGGPPAGSPSSPISPSAPRLALVAPLFLALAGATLLATLLVFVIWLARRRGGGRAGGSTPTATSPPPPGTLAPPTRSG